MAIYTRQGNEIDIVGYCGHHKPPWARTHLVLTKVRFKEDGSSLHYFATNLVADGGWNEIDEAVDSAPDIELTRNELDHALAEAE